MRMQKTILRNNTGFTLIELIFAATLLSVMFAIAITAFIGVLRFSIWSRTTRTNQAAARETLDVMTRLIESNDILTVSPTEICLNNPIDNKSTKILLDPAIKVAQKKTFNTSNCSGVVVEASNISNTNLKIQSLVFSRVEGAVNSNAFLATHPAALNNSTSVIIELTIVNGTAISLGGVLQCPPAENFCDVAKFITAVSGG